ncbi:MAG: threonine synthase [Ilumatobacteraceae bacterium]
MRYVSTRGRAPESGFCDTLIDGLAPDGGLYMPKEWPQTQISVSGTYAERAAAIMQPFIGEEIPSDVFLALCRDAYSTFRHDDVAPLVQLAPEHYLLELFHGPTLAFKDIALQLVGRLFDYVLTQRDERVLVIGATSGDTGSAAIDAVKNCKNVDIVILYPSNRTSEFQRRQMTTVNAPNVHTVAIDGNFDDCQDLVKAMFNDSVFRNTHNLSAVNSINWSRVMAQTVYYFTAIKALDRQVSGRDDSGRQVSFSVPTGNFGNVLAGWIARQMGAPIRHLIVGSNSNDVLTRFIDTRVMTMSDVIPTLSPSMDIQVSSNFERLLFEMNHRDGGLTAEQLQRFRVTGAMSVESDQFDAWVTPVFRAHRCDDNETIATMRRIFDDTGMLIDPHTAVAVASTEACSEPGVPTITLATAHPAKFPDVVFRATGIEPLLPEHLVDLYERPECTTNLPNDLAAVQAFVASCH